MAAQMWPESFGSRPMSFTILRLSPDADPSWPEKISWTVPDAVGKTYADPNGRSCRYRAPPMRPTASCRPNCSPGRRSCAGSVRPAPDLCVSCRKSASRIRLGDPWFSDALVTSDVVVTGMHGSCNEHLSTHEVAFLLTFARRFEHCLPQQRWQRGPG